MAVGKRKRSSISSSSSRKRLTCSNRIVDESDNDDASSTVTTGSTFTEESQQQDYDEQSLSNRRRHKECEGEPAAKGTSMESQSFLTKEQVWLGMDIEICDKDNIWSSARVIRVKEEQSSNRNKKKEKGQHFPLETVTVRYNGWGPKWDETVKMKDNERLVKLGTFTKRLKCLVDLLPSREGKKDCSKYSSLWPCIVNVRNPNPLASNEDYDLSKEFLRDEPNIFIQPYGVKEKYLAKNVISTLGLMQGQWINVARVRMWRHDSTSIEGETAPNFELAYNMALNDDKVKDFLPYGAFENGSLIHSNYRMKPKIPSTNEQDTDHLLDSKYRLDSDEKTELSSSASTEESSLKHDSSYHNQDKNNQVPQNIHLNKISSDNHNDSFSMNEWTTQHTKHNWYELEKFRAKFEELKKIRKLEALEKVKERKSKHKCRS